MKRNLLIMLIMVLGPATLISVDKKISLTGPEDEIPGLFTQQSAITPVAVEQPALEYARPLPGPVIYKEQLFGQEITSDNATGFLMQGETLEFTIDLSGTISHEYSGELPEEEDLLAVQRAPLWLRKELDYNLRLLSSKKGLYNYSALLADVWENNRQIYDEVAFLVAHMSVQMLTSVRFRSANFLVENCEFIYMIQDSLKYVRLKEHGSPESGDYYTTTEYRIKDGANGDTVWTELPYQYYYWYIVHPKLNLEGVYKADQTNSATQRTYDYIWRDFIWNNPDPEHNYMPVNIVAEHDSVKTIRRFGELARQPEILWDRDKTYYYFGRQYSDNDDALNKFCNWASRAIPADPASASAPRPLQPNHILTLHRGRCGEDSHLLSAVLRTALIPAIVLTTSREDHAFCAFWDQDWNHIEFFRGGLAHEGWGWTNLMERGAYEAMEPDYWVLSIVFGMRPDGYMPQFSQYYTDTCNLKLKVVDESGAPLDGTRVKIFATPGHPSIGDNALAYCADVWTDHNGEISIPAGDSKYYLYQVIHDNFGTIPAETSVYPWVCSIINGQVSGQKSKPDIVYPQTCIVTQYSMPTEKFTALSYDGTAQYGIKLDLNITDIIVGKSDRETHQSVFAKWNEEGRGSIGFFLCDDANYELYKSGDAFEAYFGRRYYTGHEFTMPVPGPGKWHLILTSEYCISDNKRYDVSCTLMEGEFSAVDRRTRAEAELKVWPNPATDVCLISAPALCKRVIIYDAMGNIVLQSNECNIQWDVSAMPSGLYFVTSSSGDGLVSQKVLVKPGNAGR